jgi:hypothetical protein
LLAGSKNIAIVNLLHILMPHVHEGHLRELVNKLDQKSGLPPPRPKSTVQALKPVDSPLNGIGLSTLLYVLGGGVLAYFMYAVFYGHIL